LLVNIWGDRPLSVDASFSQKGASHTRLKAGKEEKQVENLCRLLSHKSI